MPYALMNTAPFRARLASNGFLRKVLLPALRRFDVPVTVRNVHADQPIKLLSYTHKGYWYYGQSREAATLARFATLVRTGDTVIEAGGHIGYVSQYLSRLVGHAGQVHVFEPGRQNSDFLAHNTTSCTNTTLVRAALADVTGTAPFYEENIGGFMNSLDPDFVRNSAQGQSRSAYLRIAESTVPVTRLDDYVAANSLTPSFLKIDVEGAELAVLRGAENTLPSLRSLMVEVTRNPADVFALLNDHKFDLSAEDGAPVTGPAQMHGNIFALRRPSAALGSQ